MNDIRIKEASSIYEKGNTKIKIEDGLITIETDKEVNINGSQSINEVSIVEKDTDNLISLVFVDEDTNEIRAILQNEHVCFVNGVELEG